MAEKEAEKTATEGAQGDQIVTPWEAKAGEGQTGIDYDKLISMLLGSGVSCLEYYSECCGDAAIIVGALFRTVWEPENR